MVANETIAFEGVEKKLEIEFFPLESNESGLRNVPRAELDRLMTLCRCTIVSRTSNDDFDAYVLSESSLFVYPYKMIIKTCGTTTPLACIPRLLTVAEEYGTSISYVCYSHKNLIAVELQPPPYNSFESEVAYLNKFFKGESYQLNGHAEDSWCLYVADYSSEDIGRDQTIEIAMFDLDRDVMSEFYLEKHANNAEETTKRVGIDKLLPGMVVDDYVFEPCGYSMNGLKDSAYCTIHITPEPECSYVSFETNAALPSFGDLAKQVISTFKPGKFTISVFADDHAPIGCTETTLGREVEGWFLAHKTYHDFGGHYNVSVCSYAKGEHRQSSSVKVKAASPVSPKRLGAEFPTLAEKPHLDDIVNRLDVKVAQVHPEFDVAEYMRKKIEADSEMEDPFFVVDLGAVYRQKERWTRELPRVQPFYACKCNTNDKIMEVLAASGVGFDCASKLEIDQALRVGASPERIVFANACKLSSHIRHAKAKGISKMTFDNAEELLKIQKHYPEADCILRILADDSHSVCQLGTKFGCHLHDCESLLELAQSLSLNVIGVSFHVGSGCFDKEAYHDALCRAKYVFDLGERLGMTFSFLDVGGGFPGSDDAQLSLEDIASVLKEGLQMFDESVTVIAEPGRYFVEKAFSLAVNVYSRRQVVNSQNTWSAASTAPSTLSRSSNAQTTVSSDTSDSDEERSERMLYYINDGVYGSFNCIIYDHAVVHPEVLLPRVPSKTMVSSTVFGPTCDAFDTVLKDVTLPILHVGDWLLFRNMGAYTVSAGSGFNGFKTEKMLYVVS